MTHIEHAVAAQYPTACDSLTQNENKHDTKEERGEMYKVKITMTRTKRMRTMMTLRVQ